MVPRNGLVTSDSSSESKFFGWFAYDESSSVGDMKWGTFEPKHSTEDDVDIEITLWNLRQRYTHCAQADPFAATKSLEKQSGQVLGSGLWRVRYGRD
ncbi:hypothetical protein V1506DRAFT_545506, partial [Lipomyces tetrasporus]